MQLLLEAGADKESARTNAATALLVAAQKSNLEVVRLLHVKLELTLTRCRQTHNCAAALFIARKSGHLEAVRLSLEAGADKDAAMADGTTALIVAAQKGHLEVMRLLLEAGADKDSERTDGARAMFLEVWSCFFQ